VVGNGRKNLLPILFSNEFTKIPLFLLGTVASQRQYNPQTNIRPVIFETEPVAAMSIIGVCVSAEPADLEAAKRWFGSVEEMLFSDGDLCSHGINSGFRDMNQAQWRPKPRALQAAYVVCLYQNWEEQTPGSQGSVGIATVWS
jgi:hypothetical protein